MIENLENEIWNDITDYPNYQVSNFGRVKSLNYRHTNQEQLLKPLNDKDGYLQVNLYNGNKKRFKIHRLVAQAFIPNPNNLPEVNHRNENKNENFVSNLEWCDRKYNMNYGTHNQRVAEKNTNGKKSKQVFQYDKDYNLIKIWPSSRECDRNGFNHGNISQCCLGNLKQYKNFIWSHSPLN